MKTILGLRKVMSGVLAFVIAAMPPAQAQYAGQAALEALRENRPAVSAAEEPAAGGIEKKGIPSGLDAEMPLSRPAVFSPRATETYAPRDLEEYDFEKALDHLNEDYASAVIVSSLSTRDLRKLTELSFETGLAVIKGKLVLFTSGGEELRIHPAAEELLKNASLIAHTHPKGQRTQPSLTDIGLAGSQVEYVIGEDGVYAYNRDGLKQDHPSDYGMLARTVTRLQERNTSTKPARDLLNHFIAAIEAYNRQPEAAEVFRSGDPATVLPGQPVIGTDALNGYVTVDQYSSSDFRINHSGFAYGQPGYVAAVLDFPAPQNLSGLSKLTFDSKRLVDCANPANVPCGRVELVDASGNKAVVDLREVLRTVWTQVDIALAPLAGQLNLQQIKQIRFVVTSEMGSMGGVNLWEIKSGGLRFDMPRSTEGYPVISGAAFNDSALTLLTNQPLPAASAFNGATITQSQNSTSQLSFTYRVQDGDDLAESRIDFGAPQNLGASLVMAMVGPTGRQLRAEVTDQSGRKAFYYLNLTGQNQNFVMPLTSPYAPAGFDAGRVVQVRFTADKAHMGSHFNNSETVYVNTKGLLFSVQGSAYAQASITTLPHYPQLRSWKVGGGSITQTQTDSTRFDFNYSVPASGDLAVSEIAWGDFVNGGFQGTPGPCGGTTNPSVIFAVSGPAGKMLKVEIIDVTHKAAVYYLQLTGSLKNYLLPLSPGVVPPGFDSTRVAAIRFVADPALMGANGAVSVETKGVYYGPAGLAPNPAMTVSDIRPLPDMGRQRGSQPFPLPTTVAPDGTVATISSPARGLYFYYETRTPGWAGSGFTYDDFMTPGIETGNLSQLSQLNFGIKGTPADVKVEVIDDQNRKAVVRLTGIQQGNEQIWSIPTGQLTGIDLTRIRMIYFIVEGANRTGNLEINHYPAGTSYPRVYQSSTEITRLPGQPTNNTVVPAGASASIAATARGGVMTYNTGTAGWVGGGFNYDNFGTTAIEIADLNGYNQLIFGLKGTPARVKVEVIDDQNRKAAVYLLQTNLNGFENEWMLETADLRAAGVDLSRVRMIYFIIEGMQQSGTLEINRIPQPFAPNSAVSIQDPGGTPRLVPISPAGAVAGVTSIPRGMRLNYSTGSAGWAGAGFAYDDPATPGVETRDLSALPYLGFGLKGNPAQVKLEVVDANNRKASILLTGIRGDLEQHWGAALLIFQAYGLDLTKIRTLYFIVEGANQSGSLEIYRTN